MFFKAKSIIPNDESMKAVLFTTMIVAFAANYAVSAPFATWTKNQLILNNNVVERVIKLPSDEGQFLTTYL
jgi:hypothetical protein